MGRSPRSNRRNEFLNLTEQFLVLLGLLFCIVQVLEQPTTAITLGLSLVARPDFRNVERIRWSVKGPSTT
jgi:hypothetical protein